jgi:hypothetical protein
MAYQLVVIGWDSKNLLKNAPGNPLGDALIATSHGCSDCLAGNMLMNTTEGLDFVPTNSAELYVLEFHNKPDGREWARKYAAALTGKTMYGYEPNFPPAAS